MISKRRDIHRITLLALSLGVPTAQAAEVRGVVNLAYQGLFKRGSADAEYPVSVALLPADGRTVPRRAARRETIEVLDNRLQPSFLTVQTGDAIEFVNRDDVFHELFSLSAGKPLASRLGKAGTAGGDSARIELGQAGTIHFFCRIHSKSYARVDVVDTPYFQMVVPGDEFIFRDLRAGTWRLRLAAPAAETAWVEVDAVTSPPKLQLTLTSHGGGGGHTETPSVEAVNRLYRHTDPHRSVP